MSSQRLEQKEKEVCDEDRKRKEQEKEHQERGEKTKVKATPHIEERKTAHILRGIKIPIVELEKPSIEAKKVDIGKEIPEIKKEEVKINIPVIELEKPVIKLNRVELDKIIPIIVPPKESKFGIPLIRLDKQKQVRRVITAFDERLPQIIPPPVTNLRVPVYRASKSVVREILSSFDGRVDAQILQCFMSKEIEEEKIKEEILTEEQKIEVALAENEPSGGEGEFEEIPDTVDFVFGASNIKISSRGPKIVLYKELEKDSTIGSFETLCIRIYREKKGGYPKFKPIKELDEFNIREIEKWMDAYGSLFTIDLDGSKDKAKEIFSQKNLREPLRRAIIGDVGFIIFKTRDEELYGYCKKMLGNLKKEIEHPLDDVYIEPKLLSFEIKKELSSLAWGNLKLDGANEFAEKPLNFERFVGTMVFDDIFNKSSKSLFEKQLERLEKEYGGIWVFATKQHAGKESSEHLQMKWFIVKLLSAERNLKTLMEIKGEIKTEEEYEGIIPDVRVGNSVYEIETLFAEDIGGRIPKKKIYDTITKYENTSIGEINLVLDNLTFLIHLIELIEVSNILRDWSETHRKTIDFWTFDLQNKQLLSLRDVTKRMKQLFNPVSPPL